MKLFSWFQRFFQRTGENPAGDNPNVKSPEEVIRLIKALQITEEVEYSCDEAFDLLDQYAEAIIERGDSAELMPLVKHHLEMCGCCREEYEALVQILKASPA